MAFARALCRISVEIVKKKEGQRTFEVLPRRWVVERTLSWISRCRRLDHDYEHLPAHAEAMVYWAMIGIMRRQSPIWVRTGRQAHDRAKRETNMTTRLSTPQDLLYPYRHPARHQRLAWRSPRTRWRDVFADASGDH